MSFVQRLGHQYYLTRPAADDGLVQGRHVTHTHDLQPVLVGLEDFGQPRFILERLEDVRP